MKNIILKSIQDSSSAILQLSKSGNVAFIEKAATLITTCFNNGGKVLIAGNGGSLSDAVHFAEELTGFFRRSRKALPAIALADPGHITCVGNDIGFEWVFARGVEAYGRPEDLFIGLTTSGNSPNIIKAFEAAKSLKLSTIALLGKNGGALKGIADCELHIEGDFHSDRIQEGHMTALHIIIEVVEHQLGFLK